MKIELMLIGCAKCKRMESNTRQALRELGWDDEIALVEDLEEIKRRGLMRAPVLYVNGEVKAVGTVLGVEDIKAILTAARQKETA